MTTPAAGDAATAAAGVTDGQQAQPTGGSSAAGQGQPAAGAQGGQPAAEDGLYAKYLAGLPRGVHGQVTEAFKTWDADVTKRQQELQSQLDPYRPLIDSGADPQRLQAASAFMDWLQEDPGEALAMAAQQLGVDLSSLVTPTDGQGAVQDQGQPDGAGAPAPGAEAEPAWFAQFKEQYAQTEQLVQLLAQQTVAQHEGAQQEQMVSELESMLTERTTAAGIDFNDEHAQRFLLNAIEVTDDSVPIDQAVQQAIESWQSLTGAIKGQAASNGVPPTLSAGGGLPTQQVDPATLTPAERRRLVAQNAERMMKQAGG